MPPMDFGLFISVTRFQFFNLGLHVKGIIKPFRIKPLTAVKFVIYPYLVQASYGLINNTSAFGKRGVMAFLRFQSLNSFKILKP